MKRNTLFALIALSVGGVSVAHAQDYSNWYVAPRIGVDFPDSDRETQSSLFSGIAAGFWYNPNFALDFEYSINNADYKSDSPRYNRQWESVGLDVAGRYFIGELGTGWRPYLMGGLGTLRHAAYSGIIQHNGWDPMATVGAGIQYNFSNRLAFRGEIAARYDRDNNSEQGQFPGIGNHTGFTDGIVTVGLTYSFGGEAAAKPAPHAETPAVAATPARPHEEPVKPEKVVIDLRGVNFKFDRPKTGEKNIEPSLKEPSSESLSILDQAVDTLKRYPNIRVEVDGHTDSIGTEAYNQKLSERRAKIVYDYLTAHGIDASRMDGPKGFGKDKPIDTNSTKEGRARNRRTELAVENQ